MADSAAERARIKREFFAGLDRLQDEDDVNDQLSSSLLSDADSAPGELIHSQKHGGADVERNTSRLVEANHPYVYVGKRPLRTSISDPSVIPVPKSTPRASTTSPKPSNPRGSKSSGHDTEKALNELTTSEVNRQADQPNANDGGLPPLPAIVRSLAASLSTRGKKPQPIRLANDRLQMFRNCAIYYYPSDDLNPARALRIRRCLEHGAIWLKVWHPETTHVIVGSGLNYVNLPEGVRKSLEHTGNLNRNVDGRNPGKSPRRPTPIIVNERYITDCVSYRCLLDPTATKYQVSGAPSDPSGEPPVQAAQQGTSTSTQSLELKSSKRMKYTPEIISPQDTQPHLQQGLAEDLHENTANESPKSYSDLGNNVHAADEFSQIVDEARDFEGIEYFQSDDEGEERTKTRKTLFAPMKFSIEPSRNLGAKNTRKGENFACLQSPQSRAGISENPNARTIEILEKMHDYYMKTSDHWRNRAYRQAIAELRRCTTKITSKEDAEKLRNIGPRLAAKIEEIALTDRLRRLESVTNDPRDQTLKLFLGIYGVGVHQANRWVELGYRTLDDLREKANLTENMKVGIDHYEDFQRRIPRAEVELHGRIVQRALKEIDPGVEAMIMGSYRRGASSSGDIDMIFTKEGADYAYLRTVVLRNLLTKLEKTGHVKASLTSPNDPECKKWMGCVALEGANAPWRRMDFLLVAPENLGATLIYFTGNDLFNRSIRLLAYRRKMKLNQYGLFKDVMRGPRQVKHNEGNLIEGRSERRIFEILGVPWREPIERNI